MLLWQPSQRHSASAPSCCSEPPRDELAIRLGPAHREVMTTEVIRGGEGLRVRATGRSARPHEPRRMDSPKPREPLWTRTTSCCLPRPKLLERPGIEHLFDRLQLGEVVATAKRAQGRSNSVDSSSDVSEKSPHVAIPRMFQVEAQIGPAVELDVTLDEVRLEQRHAAADVAADEVRVDDALGHEGRTDRAAFARVQIREADRQAHPIKFAAA